MLNAMSRAPRMTSVGRRARLRRRIGITGRLGGVGLPGPGMSKLTHSPFGRWWRAGTLGPLRGRATSGGARSTYRRPAGVPMPAAPPVRSRARSERIEGMATILDRVTLDIEQHAAASGWDQPPRLFALVETADLVRREP